MINSPLVSIIATFYNSGEFVTSAMDTLLNQSYKNIEFICINDGSTDNTLERLKIFAEKDKRIKLYSKENENSPHNALAYGQERINGDYVMSFDHDDSLSIDAIELGVKSLLENPSWDASLFRVFTVNNRIKNEDLKKRPTKPLTGKEAVIACVKGFEYSIRPFYKSKIYKSVNYRFKNTWQNYDEYIGIKILGNCSNIGLNNGIYYYHDNPNSITSNIKFRHIEALEVHFLLMKDYLIKTNIYDEIKDSYENIIFKRLNNTVNYYYNSVLKNITINNKEQEYANNLFKRCYDKLNKDLLVKNSNGLSKIYLKLIFSNFIIYSFFRKLK